MFIQTFISSPNYTPSLGFNIPRPRANFIGRILALRWAKPRHAGRPTDSASEDNNQSQSRGIPAEIKCSLHTFTLPARRFTGVVFICLVTLYLSACEKGQSPHPPAENNAPLFADVTTELGLKKAAESWPPGTYFLPELMGGGLALFDSDNDADLDLLQIRFPPPGRPRDPAPNRFFQQGAEGKFIDRTASSGLGDPGYGQGVATGDTDNDGDIDVYITNFGADAFYQNNGAGSFSAATVETGFTGSAWSTSAAFVDYDADGDLDLYVVHYLHYNGTHCNDLSNAPEYCGPQHFKGTLDRLYRNQGDGTFEDATTEAGIDTPGKGLGVLCADLSGDGLVDIYVANDADLNQLWVNRGNGTFVDQAIPRGIGVNAQGRAEASMGVTIGDADADGLFDLFLTHLRNETNTLYLGQQGSTFADRTSTAGFGTADLPYTGFGCGFFDLENDGDQDIALVNGSIKRGPPRPGLKAGSFWNRYAEPNLIFVNDGRGFFSNASNPKDSFHTTNDVHRGLAFGDIDRDGAIDLALGTLGGIRIFRNRTPTAGNHWLQVRALVGKRDALGALVRIRAGERQWAGLVLMAYSYLSSSAPQVHFGLGPTETIDAIDIKWPDGSQERFTTSAIDREVTLVQGTGAPL